jgi:uncharacterized integral membrane protein
MNVTIFILITFCLFTVLNVSSQRFPYTGYPNNQYYFPYGFVVLSACIYKLDMDTTNGLQIMDIGTQIGLNFVEDIMMTG